MKEASHFVVPARLGVQVIVAEGVDVAYDQSGVIDVVTLVGSNLLARADWRNEDTSLQSFVLVVVSHLNCFIGVERRYDWLKSSEDTVEYVAMTFG